MVGSDTQRTAKWLYGVLSGDSTLSSLGLAGVYHGSAPVEASYPFARITMETSLSSGGNGGLHIFSVMQWRIIVIDATWGTRVGRSFEGLRPLVERIIALLDGADDTTSELAIASCDRVEEIQRDYIENGISYREAGMIWRIIARSAS